MADPLLIQKILDEVATPQEMALFREMLQGMDQDEYARWIDDYLNRAGFSTADSGKWRDTRSLELVLQKINEQQATIPATGHSITPRVHRVPFLKMAAAILLVAMGMVVYYNFYLTAPSAKIVQNTPPVAPVDVPPASNKAVLTLSNGQQVQLNNNASGTIKDGNLAIKNEKGILVYNDATGRAENAETANNTMTTPNGGLYMLTLSDGTKVWLDAASSITYPVAFAGTNRKVQITGEAYFEVAKDAKRPFIVDVNGQATVEVLGTHFNINAYANEQTIKATLLEGAVKIRKAGVSAVLTPGLQAVLPNGVPATVVTNKADIDQVMAWKNGLFTFNKADLPFLMRQLERWYDIKVKYNGKLPDIVLKGKMYRNVNLSDVLEFLQNSGVTTRLEGKTLIVL